MTLVRSSELPQWIISSDRGAYAPHTRTIYLRRGEPWTTLVHELGHWVIDIAGGGKRLHRVWDWWHCTVGGGV